MIRAIFDQAHAADSALLDHARRSLLWWTDVLRRRVCETREWACVDERPPIVILADARGEPPNIAAILLDGECVEFCDMPAPEDFLESLLQRKDSQIVALEMLARLDIVVPIDFVPGRDTLRSKSHL